MACGLRCAEGVPKELTSFWHHCDDWEDGGVKGKKEKQNAE